MEWIFILFGVLLILGTGFFVAVEFSLVALDKSTVQQAIDRGEAGAKPLLQCLTSLSTQLSSCQLGITLTTLTGYVLEPAMSKSLAPVLENFGIGGGLCAVAVVISMVVATPLSMLIGELVPKNLAIAKAMAVGKVLARPQLVFTAIFKPAIVFAQRFFEHDPAQVLRPRSEGRNFRRPQCPRTCLAGSPFRGTWHPRHSDRAICGINH